MNRERKARESTPTPNISPHRYSLRNNICDACTCLKPNKTLSTSKSVIKSWRTFCWIVSTYLHVDLRSSDIPIHEGTKKPALCTAITIYCAKVLMENCEARVTNSLIYFDCNIKFTSKLNSHSLQIYWMTNQISVNRCCWSMNVIFFYQMIGMQNYREIASNALITFVYL